MTARWRAAIRMLIVVFLIFTASPATSRAQGATPVAAPDAPPAIDSAPTPASAAPSTIWTMPGAEDGSTVPPGEGISASPTLLPETTLPGRSLTEDARTVEIYVSKTYCQDTNRQGTTDFVRHVESARALATSCSIVPAPDPDQYPVTVTLTNVDDPSLRYSDTLRAWPYGGYDVQFSGIPTGTYTVAQSGPGIPNVASGPMIFSDWSAAVEIIDYVPETTLPQPEPSPENAALDGSIYFCTSPDRAEGDVEFRIDNTSLSSFAAPAQPAGIIQCEPAPEGFSFDGQIIAWPYDPDTGQIDRTNQYPATAGGYLGYHVPFLETGEWYVLGWVDPQTGNAILSAPFAVQGDSPFPQTIVDILLFSDPVATASVRVTVEACVDATRVGQTSFTVFSDAMAASAAATLCRELGSGNSPDAPVTLELTNIETRRTWQMSGTTSWDFGVFSGVPSGTYTLSRIDSGTPATSDPFEVNADGETSITVRTYIADSDWTWPPAEGALVVVSVDAFVCLDPGSGAAGAFHFPYIPAQETGDIAPAPVADLTLCRPATANDHVSFTLGQDGTTVVLGSGWEEGSYEIWLDETDLAAREGHFELIEASTGVSSGHLLMAGSVDATFYLYQGANVTLDVTSSAPEIASSLPEQATWAISQGEDTVISGAFEPEGLLPTTVRVPGGLPAGDYTLTVDAGAGFEPYAANMTINQLSQNIDIELVPVRSIPTATFTLVSGNPELAGTIPAGSTWTITSDDEDFRLTGSWTGNTALPAIVDTGDALFASRFTLHIDAGSAFEPFSEHIEVMLGTRDLGTFTLVPVEASETFTVEFELDSADPAIANRMPEGASWELTALSSPDSAFAGTFGVDDLHLPAVVTLPHRIPAGEYTLAIDATPGFEPYNAVVTIGADTDTTVPLSLHGFLARQDSPVVIGVLLQPRQVEPGPSPNPPGTSTPVPTGTPETTATATATTAPMPTSESETTPTATAIPGKAAPESPRSPRPVSATQHPPPARRCRSWPSPPSSRSSPAS